MASNRMQELEDQEMADSKVLKLTEFVTANELATMMDVSVNQVIATCMSIGIMVSINQRLDAETINLVAEEFGFKTEYVSAEVAQAIVEEEDAPEDLQPRAPIVTVMGHVDHGKTSLLDYIRKANVIAGEAGGITQHIGAYNVQLEDGRRITFLDTPGHEAFTAMRARGAKVTDIAIIIVAADDNVMPQTKEAINHAMAAGVPIVFAINKVDKPTANPDKIKEELAAMNYLVEEWGGKYQSQDISAKKGMGVEDLLEKVLLEAEMLDLKANPDRNATGSIIESSLDKGRGYVATVLVSNGTLKVGDIVLAGTSYGRVKAMFNERNQRIKEAGPSEPALILGLNGAPAAGDTFHVIDTEQEQNSDGEKDRKQQGIEQRKVPLFPDGAPQLKRTDGDDNAEKGGVFDQFTHHRLSSRFWRRRITRCVVHPAAANTVNVDTTTIAANGSHTGCSTSHFSRRPTPAGTNSIGMISSRKALVSRMASAFKRRVSSAAKSRTIP